MNNYEEKVEEYFKLVYPEFDQLSIDNKLIAIEDEKLICEHFEEINEALGAGIDYYEIKLVHDLMEGE